MASSKKKQLWTACQQKKKAKAPAPYYRKFDKRTAPDKRAMKGSR